MWPLVELGPQDYISANSRPLLWYSSRTAASQRRNFSFLIFWCFRRFGFERCAETFTSKTNCYRALYKSFLYIWIILAFIRVRADFENLEIGKGIENSKFVWKFWKNYRKSTMSISKYLYSLIGWFGCGIFFLTSTEFVVLVIQISVYRKRLWRVNSPRCTNHVYPIAPCYYAKC